MLAATQGRHDPDQLPSADRANDGDIKQTILRVRLRADRDATVEDIRQRIATQIAATAQTGIAQLPIRRRDVGDFIGHCGLIVGRVTVDDPEIAYRAVPACPRTRMTGH